MTEKKLLKEILKDRRVKTAPKERTAKVLKDLTDLLKETVPDGEVVSVITYDFHNKRINNYGERLPEEAVFEYFHLSMMVQGTRVTGTISYPDIARLSSESYRKGYFVPLSDLEAGEKDKYVALVNIKLDFADLEEKVDRAIPYHI